MAANPRSSPSNDVAQLHKHAHSTKWDRISEDSRPTTPAGLIDVDRDLIGRVSRRLPAGNATPISLELDKKGLLAADAYAARRRLHDAGLFF